MAECKKYTKKVRFDIVKNGTAFHINRPSFKSGSSVINKMNYVAPLENVRLGVGNRNIVRNNFIAPPIRSREIIDFERLQAQDIEMGGIKVQFGDKTIEKLFKIQIDDKTDIAWVDERNRRLASGETETQINNNPPFGREQRKVNKMTNFGEQNLSLEDKIEQIAVAVKQGNSETIGEMGKMAVAISALLGNVDTLSKMTIKDLAKRANLDGFVNDWQSENDYFLPAGYAFSKPAMRFKGSKTSNYMLLLWQMLILN
jgi:hypothetical protein